MWITHNQRLKIVENCLNCDNPIAENFCSNCGQKKYKRIDRKYIIDELQYSFVHTNKGFFYSLKNIVKNPGKTAKDFIDGNRVNHYKPLLLAFVISGISAFISFKVIGTREIMEEVYSKDNIDRTFMERYMTFMTSYNAFIMLLLVPIFAIFTKIGFRKWGHNYYEHVIMNAMILICYTVVSIMIVSPLIYVFGNNHTAFSAVMMLSILLIPFILVWFFKNLYDDKPLKSIIWRVLAIMFAMVIVFFIMIVLAVIIYFTYLGMYHPEVLETMKKTKQ